MTGGQARGPGTADAVVLGLAAMLGTGVFAVWGPAATAAGPWIPVAVLLAAVVALCNAWSTADCAAAHPEGGGYVYGRERLCPAAGRLAGVAQLVGAAAAAGAAALVFGWYVLPARPGVVAIAVVVVVTALNIAGVRWTARGAWALVGGLLVVLLMVVLCGLFGGHVEPAAATPALPAAPLVQGTGMPGVLTAAALVSFAFFGYARIARLRAKMRDPARTVRRAIAITLTVALVTYLLVAAALLVGLGSDRLAGEPAPLAVLVDNGQAHALGVLVRVGAAVATGSALLGALVGLSRAALAMARRGELPRLFTVVSGRGAPWRADVAGGLVAIVVVLVAGPVAAITVAACAGLVHYAVINAAALRLPARTFSAWTSWLGLVLCLGLAAMLPTRAVLVTLAAIVVGWAGCTVAGRVAARRARQRPRATVPDREPDEDRTDD